MTNRKQALEQLRDKVKVGERGTGLNTSSCFSAPYDMDAVDAFDGSLDAALALHEAVLPEWVVESIMIWGDNCSVRLLETHEKDDGQWHGSKDKSASAKDRTPARAWLLAILDALIAQEGE